MSATRWTRSSLNVHGMSTLRHGVARSAFVGAGSSRATYSSCRPAVSACSTSSADFIPCRIIQARPATDNRLSASPIRSSRWSPPRRERRTTYAEVPATVIARLCGASSLVSQPEKKLGTASGLLPGSGRSPLSVSAAPAADRRTKRRPMRPVNQPPNLTRRQGPDRQAVPCVHAETRRPRRGLPLLRDPHDAHARRGAHADRLLRGEGALLLRPDAGLHRGPRGARAGLPPEARHGATEPVPAVLDPGRRLRPRLPPAPDHRPVTGWGPRDR